MWPVYRTLSVRYLRQRWGRVVLIVASIALGVATLVATGALNHTMARAVQLVTNPLSGFADLQVTNGGFPVDRGLAGDLARVPGVRSVRPLVQANVSLPDLPERPVLLLGLDWQQALKDAPAVGAGGQAIDISPGVREQVVECLFLGQKPVLVGKQLAAALPGDERTFAVRVAGKEEPRQVTRVGTVDGHGPAAALGGNVLVTDLDLAAGLLGRGRDSFSRIDLLLEPGADRERVRRDVEQALDGRAVVQTPEAQDQKVHDVMAGLQIGFALCGAGALVVGLFLVYNALSVSVAERRHEIGILRSVGATRGQVCALFVGEAGLMGLAGAAAGVPSGVWLAGLGVRPMQQVLSDLFTALDVERARFTPGLLISAALAGVITGLVAAALPAVRAAGEEPADAVRRVPSAPGLRRHRFGLAGSALLLAAGACCIGLRERLPARWGSYGGLVLVLTGGLLLMPLLTALVARLLLPVTRPLWGIEGRLAADNLVRSPARTGLVITALAAGVALVMQTAGVIRSNNAAILKWVDDSIVADLFVSSGSPISGSGQNQEMDEKVGGRLAGLPEVEAALPVRFRQVDYGDTLVLVVALDAAGFYAADQKRGDVPGLGLFPGLREPGPPRAVLSENFAALHHLGEGDVVTLRGRDGPVDLRVIGTMVDYSWNRGTIIMDRDVYRRLFDDRWVDVFDVYLRPGADAAVVREDMLRRWGAEGLVVLTRDELRERIKGIIERLYGLAYSQEIVVGVVAALGVVTALLISVLQRRRELGLLRAVGATRAQVLGSVLAEAVLMGVVGLVIGLLVGIPLEWYCVRVLLFEEAGFLFPVCVPWLEAAVIAVVALGLATLAGLAPALQTLRLRIPEAIAYE